MPNLQILGTTLSRDSTGIMQLKEKWVCETIEAAIDLLQSSETRHGLRQTSGTSGQAEDGRYEADIVYEGLQANSDSSNEGRPPGSPGGSPGASPERVEVSFEGANQQVPFPQHPYFAKLAQKYEWDPDLQQFSVTTRGTVAGATGLGSGAARQSSPLAGESAFLLEGGTLTITYAARSIPAKALTKIGAIEEPWINLPGISYKDRNFRKLAPRITKRGNAFQIQERYAMSGIIKWNEDVYSFNQLP